MTGVSARGYRRMAAARPSSVRVAATSSTCPRSLPRIPRTTRRPPPTTTRSCPTGSSRARSSHASRRRASAGCSDRGTAAAPRRRPARGGASHRSLPGRGEALARHRALRHPPPRRARRPDRRRTDRGARARRGGPARLQRRPSREPLLPAAAEDEARAASHDAVPDLRDPRHSGPDAPQVRGPRRRGGLRSEEHTSELQSHSDLVCRLLLEKKKKKKKRLINTKKKKQQK